MGVRHFTRCTRLATRLAIPDIQLRARFPSTALFRTKDIQNVRRIRHRRAFDPRVARFLKRQQSALTRPSAPWHYHSHLVSHAPHVYGRYPARACAQSRARLASPRNIPRSASLDSASHARATFRPAHEKLRSSLVFRSRYYSFGSNSTIRTRVLPSAAFLADI